MKIMTTNIEKRNYIAPLLTKIELDNEISLVLVSGGDDPNDPLKPTGQNMETPGFLNNDPYRNMI